MLHCEIRILNLGDPPAWPELSGIEEARLEKVAVLQNGMKSGKASLGMIIQLPTGERVIVQTSAGMFLTIASAVKGACDRWDGK